MKLSEVRKLVLYMGTSFFSDSLHLGLILKILFIIKADVNIEEDDCVDPRNLACEKFYDIKGRVYELAL